MAEGLRLRKIYVRIPMKMFISIKQRNLLDQIDIIVEELLRDYLLELDEDAGVIY